MTVKTTEHKTAKIKVIGVGGGGTNAVTTMIKEKIEGVDFMCANSDIQSLDASLAPKKIQVGKELTKGLGAGADPDIGRDAALEDRHEIQEALAGADMIFITAGMGGGTGTGGASVIAQIAKEQGALTVGVVTKPFIFEGKRRRKHAELGIERLREHIDTLIVIPNQRLLQIATPDLSMLDAFHLADRVLVNAVKGISDIINIPGTVNVDFADVKTIMSNTGQAIMGIGEASGENRAQIAAEQAISSPLLEDIDIEGATGILINITAGAQIGLLEVNEACEVVQEAAHEDAHIIFGTVINESLEDMIRVTVIATGFPPSQADEVTVTESIKAKIIQDLIKERDSQKMEVAPKVVETPPQPVQTAPAPTHTTPEPAQFVQQPEPTTQAEPTFITEPAHAATAQTHETATIVSKTKTEPEFTEVTLPTISKPEAFQSHSELVEELTPTVTPQMPEMETAPTPQEPPQTTATTENEGASTPLRDTMQLAMETLEKADMHYQDTPDADPSIQTETNTTENAPTIEPLEGTQEPHVTTHILEEEKQLTLDIDRKIEEALDLAERIKKLDTQDDELDIPAFLRNNTSSQASTS